MTAEEIAALNTEIENLPDEQKTARAESGTDMVQRYAHLSNEPFAQVVGRRNDTVFATGKNQGDRLSA